ncbi:hypothetical protein B0H13DRAFT_2305426 [Mycena leptocephala]|nr:hypothetical protein B0H13DRAFT_2305426 [Mycena leptocephala]
MSRQVNESTTVVANIYGEAQEARVDPCTPLALPCTSFLPPSYATPSHGSYTTLRRLSVPHAPFHVTALSPSSPIPLARPLALIRKSPPG